MRLNTHHQLFSILILFFGEFPRRRHAVGVPRRVLESITNVTARYAWANLIEASSVFRFSAGARLCRITLPRNSSVCCHSAGIRHYPGFGMSGGPVLGSAMHQEASWSRSNFSWGTFRCRRPNATLAASSGFDQPSMIALASSLILELTILLQQAVSGPRDKLYGMRGYFDTSTSPA